MARKRKKKRAGKKVLDPSEVLSGGTYPTVDQLVELIARINPTGSSLPPDEMRRKYEQKSALQGLLINRHADELTVKLDPEQEGVVVLRHRYGHRDACHAVIDELDVDARAWVRLQLDTLEPVTESRTLHNQERKRGPKRQKEHDRELPPAEETDPDVLMERSSRAIEEYDYEEARSCLEEALERTGGALDAALAMLELLVDHLGLYDEALDLPGRLPASVASDPEIRSLLALAAGRAGRVKDAERWVKHLGSGRAGEVHLVLSDVAEKAGELKKATGHLKKASSLGADPTEILNIEKAITSRQAEIHGHEEAEIGSLLEDGDVENAAIKARELLAAWPKSQVARRAVREAENHKRIDRLQECLSQAEEVFKGGDLREGVELLRRALELGGDAGKLEPRIAEAEEELRRLAEKRELERVERHLGAEDRALGLLAYLNLEEEQRARVREHSEMQALEWMEEMGAPRLGVRQRPEAAAAVLALERAMAELEDGRIEPAAKVVQEHIKLLGGVKDANRVLSELRKKQEEDRRKLAGESLRRLREAMDSGDLAAARSAASSLDNSQLPESERSEAEGLMAGLREREEKQRLLDVFKSKNEKGDLLAARAAARELAEKSYEGERQSWLEQVENLNRRIRLEWRVHVVEEWEQNVKCSDELPTMFFHDVTTVWLTPDGKEMLYATSFGSWLFIRIIEVATSRVRSAVAFKTPEPMEEFLELLVCDDLVWIADCAGHLMGVDRSSWDIRSWHDYRTFIPADERLEHVIPVPSRRFFWVETDAGVGDCKVRVLDLENRRVHRDVEDIMWTNMLVPAESPRFLIGKRGGVFTIMNEGGSPAPPGRVQSAGEIGAAAVHPDGERLILLEMRNAAGASEDFHFAKLRVLGPDGSLSAPVGLPDSYEDGRHELVTSRSLGCTFTVLDTVDGGNQLLAFRYEEGSLHEIYRTEIPKSYRPVQDSRANHAALLLRGPEEIRVVPLGEKPPVVEGIDHAEYHLGSLTLSLMHCKWKERFDPEEVLKVPRRLRALTAKARQRWVDDVWKKHADNPEKLMMALKGLEYAHSEAGKDLARKAIERHPSDRMLILQLAHMEAEEEHWEEVGRLLSGLEPDGLDTACREHWRHLLGMARYFSGETDEAVGLWMQALSEGGGEHCDLKRLMMDLLEDPPDAARPDGLDVEKSLAHRLRKTIRAFDEAMERGDESETLRLIDRPVVWRVCELQSLARLAAAMLERPSKNPSERYRKAVALAMFIQGHKKRESRFERGLPMSRGRWDEKRLDELGERCREWLEGWA